MAGRAPDAIHCYKTIPTAAEPVPCLLDVYFPPSFTSQHAPIPTVLYLHGGGMNVGNRQAWFPKWLYEHAMALGYLFISADYQLMPAATGHDVVQDMKDLFKFMSETQFKSDGSGASAKVDMSRVAVTGSSAGGLCAYMATIHCKPRPKALLSLYGQGGNFFCSHYLEVKTSSFDRGREMLDPADFKEYIYPFTPSSLGRQVCTDSPLAYHPQTYRIPGYPANPRMLLCRFQLQTATFLDYWTGEFEPSLSGRLGEVFAVEKPYLDAEPDRAFEALVRVLPERHRAIFPQLNVDSDWPPTMIFQGTADTAVPPGESANMERLLKKAGVPVELLTFEGMNHSFDYDPRAAALFAAEFDRVKVFLQKHLGHRANY